MPNPGNPQDYDRYSYARNNPLRFTDPTGHCSGDPSDLENPDLPCWKMIFLIQQSHDNVIIHPALWTTQELRALKHTFETHIFYNDLISASSIEFVRDTVYIDPEVGLEREKVGGNTEALDPEHIILTMYDKAYQIPPNVNSEVPSSLNNFAAQISHELAHAAMATNPSIMKSYEESIPFMHRIGFGLPSPFGHSYGGNLSNAEKVAISAAMWQYDPAGFTIRVLVVSFTDWHKGWIDQFNALNHLD